MVDIELNLSFKRLNALSIGQFPPVKLILQLTAFLRQRFHHLYLGGFPEQVGFISGQVYLLKMPVAVSVPPF